MPIYLKDICNRHKVFKDSNLLIYENLPMPIVYNFDVFFFQH
jgi:hypothetical protein